MGEDDACCGGRVRKDRIQDQAASSQLFPGVKVNRNGPEHRSVKTFGAGSPFCQEEEKSAVKIPY